MSDMLERIFGERCACGHPGRHVICLDYRFVLEDRARQFSREELVGMTQRMIVRHGEHSECYSPVDREAIMILIREAVRRGYTEEPFIAPWDKSPFE